MAYEIWSTHCLRSLISVLVVSGNPSLSLSITLKVISVEKRCLVKVQKSYLSGTSKHIPGRWSKSCSDTPTKDAAAARMGFLHVILSVAQTFRPTLKLKTRKKVVLSMANNMRD